eukprot:Sdes_comp19141_c0_seq2m9877
MLSLALTTSFVFYISAPAYHIPAEYFPILFYVFSCFLMITRQNIFYFRLRTCFWKIFARILFPIHPIHFSEILLADILTTLSKVFADVEVMICVILSHFTLRDNINATSGCMHSLIMPFVASVPSLFRARQCIIAYSSSSEASPQILNFFKYLSAFPVIWLSFIKTLVADTIYASLTEKLWFYSLVINSAFSFVWDVFMDWGLGDRKHKYLRSQLMYRYSSFYYFIILFNFCARFTWSISLSQHLQLNMHETIFLFELIEVFRRFLWIFLRIEWQIISQPSFSMLRRDTPQIQLFERSII